MKYEIGDIIRIKFHISNILWKGRLMEVILVGTNDTLGIKEPGQTSDSWHGIHIDHVEFVRRPYRG